MMLSIILPSIRMNNIPRLIESIDYDDYELIIVGPYTKHNLSDYLVDNKLLSKVKIITDYGHVTRCIQIGLTLVSGDYITVMCDDGMYQTNQINNIMNALKTMGGYENQKLIITGRYSESNLRVHQPLEYFLIHNMDRVTRHSRPVYQASKVTLQDNWVLTSFAFIRRDYLEYLGGYDCQYETPAFSVACDLSIRCYMDGAQISFWDETLVHCDWEPTHPSHQAIEIAHVGPDTDYYINKNMCIRIPLDNWKKVSAVWEKRKDINNNYIIYW